MSRLGTFSLPAVPFTGACPAQAHKGDHDDHDLDHFCGLHHEDDTNAEVEGVSIYFTSSKQQS